MAEVIGGGESRIAIGHSLLIDELQQAAVGSLQGNQIGRITTVRPISPATIMPKREE